MLYHPKEHSFIKIVKLFAFWASLLMMFWIFIVIIRHDEKIAQKEVVIELELENKVNICYPDEL